VGALSIVIIPNPLKPAERTVTRIKQSVRVRDLVPQAKQARVVINGVEGTLDSVITPGDTVAVVLLPAAPVAAAFAAFFTASGFAATLANALIGFAINAVLGAIFKPKKPAAQAATADPSPTYSIGAANNQARLGAAIPVVYGTVARYTPDYAAQPYTEFVGEDQYLCALFCLGVGDVRVNDIYVGNTLLTEGHEHTLRVYTPAQHGNVFGGIQHDWNTNRPPNIPSGHVPFLENVWSSQDLGEIQLAAANEPDQTGAAVGAHYRVVGPYTVGKSNYPMRIESVQIDIQLPRGIYRQDNAGAFFEHAVKIHIDWDRVDDNNTVTQSGSYEPEFKGAHDRPRMYTLNLPAPAGGWNAAAGTRIRVRAYRLTDSKLDRYHQDQVVWTGLKVRFDAPAANTPAYNGVTLAALRLKASSAFSSSSSQQVSMSVTRLSGGNPLSNPADVYTDIITNQVLIASPVPAVQIDTTAVNAARLKWQGAVEFNGVLDQQTTAWEASQVALQVAGAAPMRVGQRMTLVHDCVKDTRMALFGRSNIVAGSLRVTYVFAQVDDPQGVKVEYRDPQNFDPRFVTVDLAGNEAPSMTNTESVVLFGCTSRDLAKQHARLRSNRRTISRKSVSFETELEGLVVLHGDRIAVSHDMPSWGQSGYFASYDAATRTAVVDQPLDWAGAGHMILVRDEFGVVHSTPVTKGADDSTMVLGTALVVSGLGGDIEPTSFAFGTSTTAVTDWIVTSMTPQGATVQIEAVAYDPKVYTGALPWQAYATTDAGPPPVVTPPAALPAIPAMPIVPPRQTPPTGPGATPPTGTSFRVPTTGELYVEYQFKWWEYKGAFDIQFGSRHYMYLTPTGLTQWTAPDGVIFHKGTAPNSIWAEWPSSAGPIPILPGEPGYIPPDIPPPYVPEGA